MKHALALIAVAVTAAILASVGSATPAGGVSALQITKECSQFDGTAGTFCTITSSNVASITRDMKVVYLQADSGGQVFESDVVLALTTLPCQCDQAYGHVAVNNTTGKGRITISGGTGVFAGFFASAAVSVDSTGTWHWDGHYGYRGKT